MPHTILLADSNNDLTSAFDADKGVISLLLRVTHLGKMRVPSESQAKLAVQSCQGLG